MNMREMDVAIVGKNSSVYLFLKPLLDKTYILKEYASNQALSDQFSIGKNIGQSVIIFSGVVSQSLKRLEKLETFHGHLTHKLKTLHKPNIILISSSAVYGSYKKIFSESDDCRPISNYGRSKLKIENDYLEKFESRLSILRLGNVLGLDTVAKTFSEINDSERYLDCRSDYTTPKRTYVDAQILFNIVRYYISNPANSQKVLNVGRIKPQTMHAAVNELGLNCNLRIANNVADDLTLDTSELFQILDIEEY